MLHDKADVVNAIEEAEKLRKDYDVVIYEKPKKLSKFLDKIQAKGYFGFCFLGEEIRELKKYELKQAIQQNSLLLLLENVRL